MESCPKLDMVTLRACLADEIYFSGRTMKSDTFIEMCEQGSPWRDVELIESIFTDDSGALLYEGGYKKRKPDSCGRIYQG